MAGYSGTPLIRKLGIRPGFRIRTFDQPKHYLSLLGEMPENVMLPGLSAANTDFMRGFVTTRAALAGLMDRATRYLARDGMLWVSWPKKASGMETEVSEATLRRAGLDAGLVDVKICAVDETWSGLKFVYRLEDR